MKDYVGNFSRKLNDLYCSAFHLKSKHIPTRKALNSWFTPELAELVKQKSNYFELLRLGAITKQENELFKNKVKVTIQKAIQAIKAMLRIIITCLPTTLEACVLPGMP